VLAVVELALLVRGQGLAEGIGNSLAQLRRCLQGEELQTFAAACIRASTWSGARQSLDHVSHTPTANFQQNAPMLRPCH
jgi:hypothetical protein